MGFLNVCKPANLSSARVVGKIKKLTGEKCGHLGTLDPLASGVLPVALGRSTRVFSYLIEKQKVYRAFFTFGKTTDTLDSEGKVLERGKSIPTSEEIESILPRFMGKISQRPPQYSAISVGGVRAYALARKGVSVELAEREVMVYDIQLEGQYSLDTYGFIITCGGGTYIRSLARDMAEALGTVGYMSGLIRTRSGEFDIETSVTLEELEKNGYVRYLLPDDYPLQHMPRVELTSDEVVQLYNGIRMQKCDLPQENFRIYSHHRLIGIGEDIGYIRLKTNLSV